MKKSDTIGLFEHLVRSHEVLKLLENYGPELPQFPGDGGNMGKAAISNSRFHVERAMLSVEKELKR